MKCCSKCGEEKPVDAFAKNATAGSGLNAWCRACMSAYAKMRNATRNFQKDPACMKVCPSCGEEKSSHHYHRAKARQDGMSLYCRLCQNHLAAASKRARPDIAKRHLAAYRRNRPEVIAAHEVVRVALRKGKLKKLPCERCGSRRVHAHHHISYQPENHLDVIWLCAKCHSEWHAVFGPVQ